MYFDGCAKNIDCPCCGDRWYQQYDGDGDEQPSIYGMPIEEYINRFKEIELPYAYVYRRDGTVVKYV